ncbi:bifunctional protein-serine/threonine kinase/phosphatase [Methyloversatilis thermotolerans]|uniref:bifunctional protein-serine/threonine kinase/phosphatase n=1 Tax=Methyloversatilis thermotolerans TaxID=1346290 RepID=UPI0003668914|nr:bifunctional protein-serine/threonine kinase/phosphatase [Methyloversatilis thermotolerans]
MALEVAISQHSSAGARSRNEDFAGAVTPAGQSLDARGVLCAVADGVGGHAKGREAAEYTVRGLLNDYYATPETWRVADALDTVLCALNRWLLAHAAHSRESCGMATTLSALVLRGTRWHVAHVGDSRIYLYRDGLLSRLTDDHTWPHPELDNVLHRAVGLDPRLNIDHFDGELQAGDIFVLVTDGVWNTLLDAGIQRTIGRAHLDMDALATELVMQSEARGAQDNCTALVAKVTALPHAALRDRLAESERLPLPPALSPGQTLDGFVVEAVLHASRETLLYRVRDPVSDELRVLKTLRTNCGPDAIAALVHEEWLARSVVSPHFPSVIRNGSRSHLYYLMSWHEGCSLRQRLDAGGHFTIDEVVRLAGTTLRALSVLHRRSIVHRDIKPDNLHLDLHGTLRILDLGVAASDSEAFREINNPGTPSYMAPELFSGQLASESSDLFALGVTLYELLTRHYPWGEIEPFQRPRFGEPIPPTRYRPDIPAWLEALLLKAIARSPEARFETAEEFLLALERGAHRPLAMPRPLPLVQRMPERVLRALLMLSLLGNLLLAGALFA